MPSQIAIMPKHCFWEILLQTLVLPSGQHCCVRTCLDLFFTGDSSREYRSIYRKRNFSWNIEIHCSLCVLPLEGSCLPFLRITYEKASMLCPLCFKISLLLKEWFTWFLCMTHNHHGFTFERSSATLCPKRQGPPIVALVAPSSVAPAAVIRGHLWLWGHWGISEGTEMTQQTQFQKGVARGWGVLGVTYSLVQRRGLRECLLCRGQSRRRR